MFKEIDLATKYIISIISSGSADRMQQLLLLKNFMNITFEKRFKDHWFDSDPLKGSGFRSVSFRSGLLDPLMKEICGISGTPEDWVSSAFSENTTLFIDPGHVTLKMEKSGMYQILETENGKYTLEADSGYFPRINYNSKSFKVGIPSYTSTSKVAESPYSSPKYSNSYTGQYYPSHPSSPYQSPATYQTNAYPPNCYQSPGINYDSTHLISSGVYPFNQARGNGYFGHDDSQEMLTAY